MFYCREKVVRLVIDFDGEGTTLVEFSLCQIGILGCDCSVLYDLEFPSNLVVHRFLKTQSVLELSCYPALSPANVYATYPDQGMNPIAKPNGTHMVYLAFSTAETPVPRQRVPYSTKGVGRTAPH
jgi:hypothetical protein